MSIRRLGLPSSGGQRHFRGHWKKQPWKASFTTGRRDCANVVQPAESTWSKERFYINGITDNTVGPERLKGRWDTLYKRDNLWSSHNLRWFTVRTTHHVYKSPIPDADAYAECYKKCYEAEMASSIILIWKREKCDGVFHHGDVR
jgi:hypothetical protein